LMYDQIPGELPRRRPASLGAVPAQNHKLVCLRFRHMERLKFCRSTRTQRFRETGPPPTCPFI
jgi:hypothetical protein